MQFPNTKNPQKEIKRMIPKTSYKAFIKAVDGYEKQDIEDRIRNPGANPIDWKSSLVQAFNNQITGMSKEDREREVNIIFQLLVRQNRLVPYLDGYAFSGRDHYPTKEEIISRYKDKKNENNHK